MKVLLLKLFFPVLLVLGTFSFARAQFETVYVGVNGLTCSQCSRTVEMRIRKLGFVSDVQMNLQHTEGKVILSENKKADIEKIAQAVVDAGFSVRYLQADLNVDNTVTQTGSCFQYKGDGYVFTQPPGKPVSGLVKLKFIGKKYETRSEYKTMQHFMDEQCGNVAGKVYHVALL